MDINYLITSENGMWANVNAKINDLRCDKYVHIQPDNDWILSYLFL